MKVVIIVTALILLMMMNKKYFFILVASFIGLLAHDYEITVSPPEGTQITYYLDTPNSTQQFPLVLIAQGSDFESVHEKYKSYRTYILEELQAACLLVEKPGINGSDTMDLKTYLNLHTPDQRVLDYLYIFSELRRTQPQWNGQIILLGGSEGADVAARLAPFIKNLNAVILLCGGGAWPFDKEIKHILQPQYCQGTKAICSHSIARGQKQLDNF